MAVPLGDPRQENTFWPPSLLEDISNPKCHRQAFPNTNLPILLILRITHGVHDFPEITIKLSGHLFENGWLSIYIFFTR